MVGGALVVPLGLLAQLKGGLSPEPAQFARETERIEALAMEAAMQAERGLGFDPRDVSEENLGYDIESHDPRSGRLRFLEVKGRVSGADTVSVSANEVRTALNKPEDFVLAVVEVDGESTITRYVRRPFQSAPDFAANSVNFNLKRLLSEATEPN